MHNIYCRFIADSMTPTIHYRSSRNASFWIINIYLFIVINIWEFPICKENFPLFEKN